MGTSTTDGEDPEAASASEQEREYRDHQPRRRSRRDVWKRGPTLGTLE
jgi:hypothetical protein